MFARTRNALPNFDVVRLVTMISIFIYFGTLRILTFSDSTRNLRNLQQALQVNVTMVGPADVWFGVRRFSFRHRSFASHGMRLVKLALVFSKMY